METYETCPACGRENDGEDTEILAKQDRYSPDDLTYYKCVVCDAEWIEGDEPEPR